MSGKPSFFDELKRRNVLRAAAFYAASAWLLVQVATQVFPFFHIAEWVVRWIVVASCIGFPFAMLFSWFYEWTSHGLKLESDISPSESITRRTGRKLDRWIIAILSMAVVLLLANQFVLHRDENKTADAVSAVTPIPGKSIAVLPFVNMSSDKEQDYFSDGLSEELLNQLAQIPQLRVIARTSSFSFKGKEVDAATIAKALNVANVLEGSVRKSANTLRITAQLVRASDSSHLWSKTYDRDLTDVFKVQDEISRDVVAALKVRLLLDRNSRKRSAPTIPKPTNTTCSGWISSGRTACETSQRAAGEFQKAIALDPNYANAYVVLSLAQSRAAEVANSPAQRAAEIKQAFATIEQAIALAPDLASGYSGRGYLRHSRAWDWQGARRISNEPSRWIPTRPDCCRPTPQSLFFSGHQKKRSRWRARRP